MFQEKDIEAYQNTKAPEELKNRIKLSIRQNEQKRQRQGKVMSAVVSMAACLTIVFLAGGVFPEKHSILSVNDHMVSYQQVELSQTSDGVQVANEGRSYTPKIQIPLEIFTTGEVSISVSEGSIQQGIEADSASDKTIVMDISKPTVIYWILTGDGNHSPVCTVLSDGKEYIYVVEFDETKSVFTIKQTR